MPKSLEQENIAQLAQRLIAELTATRLKKDNIGWAKTKQKNLNINPPRLTHNSTA